MTTGIRGDFARQLDQERQRRHLSVRGAARVARVPPATMQGWLNGRHLPTPALRPRFVAFVEFLGLEDQLDPAMWRGNGA